MAATRIPVCRGAAPLEAEVLGVLHGELWRNVTNADELLRAVRAGKLRPSNVVLLNADMIYNEEHLVAGARRAYYASTHGKMATRSIGSELIHALSPSTNLVDSFAWFGLNSKCTSVVVLRMDVAENSDAAVEINLEPAVCGDRQPWSSLGTGCDTALLAKIWQLESQKGSEDAFLLDLLECVATKGFV